jgi:copper chaperone CopZ
MVSAAIVPRKTGGEPKVIAEFRVDGMHCESCVSLIRMNLSELEGIRTVSGDHSKGIIRVETDGNADWQRIVQKIEQDGYKVISEKKA